MKNVKKLMATAIISVFAISAAGCNMIAKTPEAIAKSPVAKVNGVTITKAQLDADPSMIQQITNLKSQYGDNYATDPNGKQALLTAKQQVRDQLVTEQLLLQKATELKLVPSDADLKSEVDKAFNDAKAQQFSNDQAQFDTALQQAGFTESSYKAFLKNQVIESKVIDYMVKNVKVTDKQIEDYYNQNKDQYTTQPNQIHLAHILVATQAEAEQIKSQLDKGADFATLAKQKSTDTGSKDKGGDLGTVPDVNSGLDATFMATALTLKAGQISNPVQTQFGYHIIKCVSRQDYPVKSLAQVKDQINSTLLDQQKQQVYTDTINQWKSKADIKTYDQNL